MRKRKKERQWEGNKERGREENKLESQDIRKERERERGRCMPLILTKEKN